MKILSPAEIGLPDKYVKWRPVQEHAFGVLNTSSKRIKVLCAPTGSGKEGIGVGAAILSGVPTCIVTSSRGLQSQYMDSFSRIGMVDIRGRSNYTCDMREDFTCEDGYASRCPYKGTIACPSSQAEMRAATSSLVVTNYDKWIAAKRFGTGMNHFQQVIFDEGHHLSEALSRAMQVSLGHREIEEKLKIDFLKGELAEDFTYWRIWASQARETAKLEMQAAQHRMESVSDPKPTWVKHFNHMRNLVRRLAIIATARAADWIVEQTDHGYQFDPIRPGRYAESTLFMRMPKIIVMSATIRPKTLFMCGVKRDDFMFEEFESDFDPQRAPIYYIPTMRVDYRNRNNMSPLWIKLDQIAARRRDVKGLVQTVSFSRAQDIINASRFWESMIINEKGEPPTEVIDRYLKSGPGTILVSPSIGTGYDFPDDAARWNFLCKIPFEPPSKIVKAREHDDPEYRPYKAIQSMVQIFGRIIRSKFDFGENFICDEHCSWFIPRWGHLAPKSFFKFYKKTDVVPPPLKLERL